MIAKQKGKATDQRANEGRRDKAVGAAEAAEAAEADETDETDETDEALEQPERRMG